ncbi:hypothetical protein FXV83_32810 [Bradyrhizobium hipponense]|uniref:Uncharacterized protein n=1 Tax=Bradyrhizobium hipponense TaxID=2605638 RepID=A0A5S4YDD1_9BRAD|nr:hypothetical protein [Bradyrhizobium hipponense]TYO62430.1 hypothetical protein FXV83_32810 [Bradyrhizobium hipponense]
MARPRRMRITDSRHDLSIAPKLLALGNRRFRSAAASEQQRLNGTAATRVTVVSWQEQDIGLSLPFLVMDDFHGRSMQVIHGRPASSQDCAGRKSTSARRIGSSL